MARAADVGVEILMTLGMPEALIGSAGDDAHRLVVARPETARRALCRGGRAACARAAEVKGGANTMVCTPPAAALGRDSSSSSAPS